MSPAFLTNWFGATVVSAMPLLLATLGTIVAGRAGVLSLGAEGFMAMGAMASAWATLATGSWIAGIAVGFFAGALLAAVFAFAVVVMRADQVVSGIATAALGAGLAGFLGQGISQLPLPAVPRLHLGPLSALPVVGRVVFSQDILAYFALALAAALSVFLARSIAGLRLRAVGEHPAAADAAGISVPMVRITAVLVGGGLCGLGGAYLSLASAQLWIENMVAGRGWIAIALVVFASWSPGRAVVGALMFGAVDSLPPRLQAAGVAFPTFLLMTAPYLATIAVLAVSRLLGSSGYEPAALGQPFLREDRV